MPVRTVGVLVLMAGMGMAVGCQGLNLSPQPGPHVELDTLRPTADFYARVDQPLLQSGSSLAGLSRENWKETTFYVPVSGVEHKPVYTMYLPKLTDSTARQRGEYPSQATVVEGTDMDSTLAQALEGVLAPVRAGWEMGWILPKMIVTPPDSTVSSPRDGYQRGPHHSLETSGGLRDMGLGVTLNPLPGHVAPAPTTPAGEPMPAAEPGVTSSPVVPPPKPPSVEPQPTPPSPGGLPSGALGAGDNPNRKKQQEPPKEPKK